MWFYFHHLRLCCVVLKTFGQVKAVAFILRNGLHVFLKGHVRKVWAYVECCYEKTTTSFCEIIFFQSSPTVRSLPPEITGLMSWRTWWLLRRVSCTVFNVSHKPEWQRLAHDQSGFLTVKILEIVKFMIRRSDLLTRVLFPQRTCIL